MQLKHAIDDCNFCSADGGAVIEMQSGSASSRNTVVMRICRECLAKTVDFANRKKRKRERPFRKRRYHGAREWNVRIPGMAPEWWDAVVEFEYPSDNERDDEAQVRLRIRKTLGVKRLPAHTEVWPVT